MTAPQPLRLRHALMLAACLGTAGPALAASQASGISVPQASAADLADRAAPVRRPDAEKLLRANNCTGCHQEDRKLVGPAFRAVAKRHAGEADAVERLKQSIRRGGGGRWGPVPMPPYPGLKDEDLQAIAEWILDLR